MPSKLIMIAALALAAPAFAQTPNAMPGEEAIDAYEVADANAGAAPITDPKVFAAFHGADGVKRIVAETLRRSKEDPRTADIFAATDMVRLNRTLAEQINYVLGAPVHYTGRTMKDAHKDMGLQKADMNILVEHLQEAMDIEKVPFSAQNKLLAKLAPMKRTMVER